MNEKIGLLKNIGLEFKKFALRGNVIDLAVGIIIGASFNKIVNSLVSDIVMPPLGFLLGRVDFSEFFFALSSKQFETIAEAKDAGVSVVAYGMFINALIAFIITAFAVFILVKAINKLQAKQEKEPEKTVSTRPCPFCFTSISIKAKRCPACTSDITPDEL
jgi:large conductance mechanosensitive channel